MKLIIPIFFTLLTAVFAVPTLTSRQLQLEAVSDLIRDEMDAITSINRFIDSTNPDILNNIFNNNARELTNFYTPFFKQENQAISQLSAMLPGDFTKTIDTFNATFSTALANIAQNIDIIDNSATITTVRCNNLLPIFASLISNVSTKAGLTDFSPSLGPTACPLVVKTEGSINVATYPLVE